MIVALRRFLFSSLSIWLAVGLFGIYFVMHLQRYVNFGIDLVGGTYITLEVQLDRVIEAELVDRVALLMKKLREEGKQVMVSQTYTSPILRVTFPDEMAARYAEGLAETKEKHLIVTRRQGVDLDYTLTQEETTRLMHNAVSGNIQVLRSRIDQFGVGEVTIATHGDRQIVVELPHVHDTQRAKAMIGTSALLEIKPVLDMGNSEEEIITRNGGKLPAGTMIVTHRESDKGHFLVSKYADLTGKLLKTAWADPVGGELGIEPVVNFEFTAEGGDKFYTLTSRGSNPMIAILIDNVVVTAARARQPLHSRGYISGQFTITYAQELAGLLRSGAFIAPVSFVEDRTIGPSLGADSIRSGLLACAVGMLLLLVFSVIVYKLAGLVAFIVLLFNLLLVLFAMSLLGATLTLPGIAGMVLTIGMAIDSSVLIYERIREELSKGVPLSAAITAGFSGALVVILDANITTFLAALVLYQIGAGPIQGFAVTMMVGIISTLVTGILLLKAIFRYLIEGLGIRTLHI